MASRRFRARASIGTVITGAERRIAYLEKNPAPRRIRGQAITTDLLYRNAVITEAIAPLAVTNGEVADSAVSNRTIQTDAIDARVISADSIVAGKISADAITAREIKANAITASELSANAVVAGKISADAITAREISANAITASEISANAVVAGKISANAVTATTIAAGSISADKIVAGGITANVLTSGTINASVISVTNLNASNITAGTLTGRTVRTGSGGDRVELSNANQVQFYLGGGQSGTIVPFPTTGGSGMKIQSTAAGGQVLVGGAVTLWPGGGGGLISTGSTGVNIGGGTGGIGLGSATLAYSNFTVDGNFFANKAGRVVGNFYNNLLAGSTVNVQVNSQGRFVRGGTSDARLKKDVQDSTIGLDVVNKLRPVTFKWNDAARDLGIGMRYGLIAQEVQDVLREAGSPSDTALVTQDSELDRDIEPNDDMSGIRQIDYSQLVPILIKAVQELSTRVEQLEGKDK